MPDNDGPPTGGEPPEASPAVRPIVAPEFLDAPLAIDTIGVVEQLRVTEPPKLTAPVNFPEPAEAEPTDLAVASTPAADEAELDARGTDAAGDVDTDRPEADTGNVDADVRVADVRAGGGNDDGGDLVMAATDDRDGVDVVEDSAPGSDLEAAEATDEAALLDDADADADADADRDDASRDDTDWAEVDGGEVGSSEAGDLEADPEAASRPGEGSAGQADTRGDQPAQTEPGQAVAGWEPVRRNGAAPGAGGFGGMGGGAALVPVGGREVVPSEPALLRALRRVRAELMAARFPLDLPGARAATVAARTLATQLDDYLLPRLSRLDAPLLVVVGGSTGAGKSTLVNSLVRTPVSPAGVLRPTTRTPVLVSHPTDARWFAEDNLLPELTRTTGLRAKAGSLRVISATALPPGLALLDAPDLDSVVAENRALADAVFAVGDLWLFVTTAARYADALPWATLRRARDRGTGLALLLDRVPAGAENVVVNHFVEMLSAEGLADVRLFLLPEVVLDGQGLLSEELVAPISNWLVELAGDEAARTRVVGGTVGGALTALRAGVEELARTADHQEAAASALRIAAATAYQNALSTVESVLLDGSLLRGEALASWREFVSGGELRQALQTRSGRLRDRAGPAVTTRPQAGGRFEAALSAALVTLIVEATAAASDRAELAWVAELAGAPLLTDVEGQSRAARIDRARTLVRDWRADLATRTRARGTGTETAQLVMLGALGGDLPVTVGAEPLAATVFGDPALRTLIKTSRDDLLARVRYLLDADAARFATALTGADTATGTATRLRTALNTGPTG